jgi:PIN domain nuclease of toxin-antitoxin system
MKLLADTHIFVWFFEGDRRLSTHHWHLIEDAGNEVFLSFASIWEMTIKVSLRKLELSIPFHSLLEVEIPRSNFSILESRLSHLIELEHLPFHHRDPFDRMIIAQSFVEKMPLITSDPTFKYYEVDLI